MAQIVYKHQYPKRLTFSTSDSYTANGINIDADATRYGFPTFAALNSSLSQINYDNNSTEIANLNFATGVKLRMSYGVKGSGAWRPEAYLDGFGFGSAAHSYDWNTVRPSVIANMMDGLPVQIAIAGTYNGERVGHSVIVDGYRSDGFFHLNYGWGATAPKPIAETWYDIPDCDTAYNFDAVYSVIYDISVYQGWNQYGADQKNTFRTKYPMPVQAPQNKWRCTTGLSRYTYGQIVVGTGGRIVAAANPQDLGQGKHPGVHIFDRHGSREAASYVTDSDYSIDSLAQNQQGDIYLACAHGTYNTRDKSILYRIPATDISTKQVLFEHSNPDPGWPDETLKIDRDDYVYVIVNPYYSANGSKLYSFTKTGAKRWEKYLGAENVSYGSMMAVDESNERVYIVYWNASTKLTTVLSLDRGDGSTKYSYTFPDTSVSPRFSAPVIDGAGDIYVGYRARVAKFSKTLSKLYERDFAGAIISKLALGPNGILYCVPGKDVGATFHPGYVRALKTADLTDRWEVGAILGGSVLTGELYLGANDVLLMGYSLSGVQRLVAIRDQGASGQVLWDIGVGGRLSFGPGNVVYTVSGDTITALSVGEIGDPDGRAQDFLNNTPPGVPSSPTPSNGASNQPTAVALGWTCADPDGHALTYDVFVCRIDAGAEAIFFPVTTKTATASFPLSGLSQGASYLWKVVASDGQTRTDGPTWTFSTENPDTQNPTTQITVPTAGSTYTSTTNRLTIAGTASDNVGVTTVTIRNNRDIGGYTCTGTTSWQYNGLPLFQGLNNISVIAYDAAGNSQTDTVAVTYNGDTQYDDVLRSGGIVQEITFPDNLTPGSTVTARWKILSYVPVVARVYGGIPGGWYFYKNGTYTGYAESPWNLSGRHAGVYSFECSWPVPQKSGEFNVWFNIAQMDCDQFMIPIIPDGVDSRPDPAYAKLIQRTILPGGNGTDPTSDPDTWSSATVFETVDQHKKRSAASVTSITLADNLTQGAQVTCDWKILSYVPVNAQLLMLNLTQQQVWLTANATRVGNPVQTTYNFQDRTTGTRYYASEYTFRATFTVPNQPGTQQIFFRCQESANPSSSWMGANVSAGIDPRPAQYNGMYGRFIERTINP